MKSSKKKFIYYLLISIGLIVVYIILANIFSDPKLFEGSTYSEDPELQQKTLLFIFIIFLIIVILVPIGIITWSKMDHKIINIMEVPEVPLILANEELCGIDILKMPIEVYDGNYKFDDNSKIKDESLLAEIQNKLYRLSLNEGKILKDNIYLFEKINLRNKYFYVGETYDYNQRFKHHKKIKNYEILYIITHCSNNFQSHIRTQLESKIVKFLKSKYNVDNKKENSYEKLNFNDRIKVQVYMNRIKSLLDSIISLPLINNF